jgi:secreted PhoX family phosphatase
MRCSRYVAAITSWEVEGWCLTFEGYSTLQIIRHDNDYVGRLGVEWEFVNESAQNRRGQQLTKMSLKSRRDVASGCTSRRENSSQVNKIMKQRKTVEN